MHLYTNPPFTRDISHEANEFAAEFLMPEKDIKGDFKDGVTLNILADLKRKWRVSMQALLYRANDIGVITDNQKRYLIIGNYTDIICSIKQSLHREFPFAF